MFDFNGLCYTVLNALVTLTIRIHLIENKIDKRIDYTLIGLVSSRESC